MGRFDVAPSWVGMEALDMTAMRHDSSHRPGPNGRGLLTNVKDLTSGSTEGFLSIVVPAKNESASLPQLVEEVAKAFRSLRGRRTDDQAHRLNGIRAPDRR